MRHLLFILLILSTVIMSFGVKLNLEYEWKYIDFLWDTPKQKQTAMDSGNYNASDIFLYDVDKAEDGRVFVTAIRDVGVPASVMTITNLRGEGGPLLRPYPDWSWYTNDCKGIRGGVYQLDIKCNHLFILDGGRVGFDIPCLPQLLIFDLSTDKLAKRVIFPRDVAYTKDGFGLLGSFTVSAPHCENIANTADVFMTDSDGYGMVLYRGRDSKVCRIESDFMKPIFSPVDLGNGREQRPSGIFSLTLSNKDLYHVTLPAKKIYKMEFSKLGCSLSDGEANKITQLVGTLPGYTVSIALKECAIFFSNIEENSILCGDSSKQINSNNMEVIAQDSETLQFPSELKSKKDQLLILTNKFNRHFSTPLNLSEINFRVLSADITEIRKQTNCFASCS